MKKIIFTAITAIFVFITPFIYAQNYPILSPGFNTEENTERETPGIRINTITLQWEVSRQGENLRLTGAALTQIKAGERLILTLRANGWYSQQPLPAFFMPEVPQGVILSPIPISSEERANGIAVKFRIIPLAAGSIVFPARTLMHENSQFNVPALNIRADKK